MLLIGGLAMMLLPALWAQEAQLPVRCTPSGETYHCNRESFRNALESAKKIRVESAPQNKMALGQLTELAGKMGKSVVFSEAPADLTFSLLRRDLGGVVIGPSGAELATLRVYGPSRSGERGDLVWVEIFTGQPDMMWPSVVHALLEQFKASAGHSGSQ